MFEFLRMQHVMLALQQPQIQSQRAPPHAIQISQIPILGGETKHETRLFQTFQCQSSVYYLGTKIHHYLHSVEKSATKVSFYNILYYFCVKIQLKHRVSIIVQIIHCETFSTSTRRIVCRQNVRNPGAKSLPRMIIMMTNHQKLKGIFCCPSHSRKMLTQNNFYWYTL